MEMSSDMSTAVFDRTGWRSAAAFASLTALTAVGLQVGTGGESTEQYYKSRGPKGYSFVHYEGLSSENGVLAYRTPADDLSHIRAVLKPTVTKLADLFGVSRQAVYGWQEGAQPSAAHASKLEDLAKAADILIAEGVTGSSSVLRRKLAGGKTLFEVVRDGGSAENAARSLVQMLRRELGQRRKLDERLAGRKRPVIDYTDVGAPSLDERA